MLDFHHGFLFQISENAKVDVYAFLFDDMLLLTRFRKLPQKVNKVRRIMTFPFFFTKASRCSNSDYTRKRETNRRKNFLSPYKTRSKTSIPVRARFT